MPISDEELIAYLLGDVDPQDWQRIQSELEHDAGLRARLNALQAVLDHLNPLRAAHEPPPDLLATTMARVDEASCERDSHRVDAALAGGYGASPLSQMAGSRVRGGTWDSAALAICLTLLMCLFLPTVVRARFESRKAQCAYQLGKAGRGLIDLAGLDPHQRFPAIAVAGLESFVGTFAIRLSDAGVVQSPSQLLCPSLEGSRPVRETLDVIPSLANLKTLDAARLEFCRNEVGGDFAYTLGVLENGIIVAPRCEGRTQFAVLADTPRIQNGREELIAHDGRGQNIFFEDGHIEFSAADCWENGIRDNPFCNLKHAHEVGLNRLDASLGPSHFRPLGNE